jgi:hypothetical protein
LGGDGDATLSSGVGGSGRPNTGSGGGAGSNSGGAGSAGIVIIRISYRILPLEFSYFDTHFKREDKVIELNWATAREWENSHFEIQRSLQDINNWEKIGSVDGKGWSHDPVEYLFKDKNLPLMGGVSYYRLKQVSFNGEFNF